jgi:type II secretory pathway component PulM
MSFSSVAEKYKLLSNREKLLILLSSLALIIALFFLVIIEPTNKTVNVFKSRLASTENNLAEHRQQNNALKHSLKQQASDVIQQQLATLGLQHDKLKETLETHKLAIISATNFSLFLSQLLTAASALQVEDIQVYTQTFIGDEASLEAIDSAIFRQQITLSLQGSDSNVKDYLAFIEQNTLGIVWNTVEYKRLDNQSTGLIISFHLFSAKE